MRHKRGKGAEINVTHRAYRGVTDELSETTFDFMLTPHVRGQLSVGVDVFSTLLAGVTLCGVLIIFEQRRQIRQENHHGCWCIG